MIWNIVTDSSCDLTRPEPGNADIILRYSSVPFIITVDGKDFVDEEGFVPDDMVDAMETCKEASRTSCPSPQTWHDAFSAEGNVIAVTISKELSGSYNSACAAREMMLEEHPDKNILVVNSHSAGAGLACIVKRLRENILSGADFDALCAYARELEAAQRTIFALCSFDNLVKNGRMSRIAGFIARHLGFWGIGVATAEGKIAIKAKERTTKKVINAFLNDMREHCGTPSMVCISHCQNPDLAERTRAAVQEAFPGVTADVMTTRGLCSYYAERHGLIIGYL